MTRITTLPEKTQRQIPNLRKQRLSMLMSQKTKDLGLRVLSMSFWKIPTITSKKYLKMKKIIIIQRCRNRLICKRDKILKSFKSKVKLSRASGGPIRMTVQVKDWESSLSW